MAKKEIKEIKEFIGKYNLSCVILAVGILFLLGGFCVPPVGVIDGSVLTAVGEIFAFTAAITGLDTYVQTRRIPISHNGSLNNCGENCGNNTEEEK